ncbi:hypothetical protein bthur0007_65380 [Bacillus thuringiensis serovar monterrey BGSC 4AJ1]|nr:hypothetical protein bthur0007_65380 [Bacillus thuringiensis serovar monterrey BGSC 4AJ1]
MTIVVLRILRKGGLEALIMRMFAKMNLVGSFQEGSVPNY